jgi:hypothetical protein
MCGAVLAGGFLFSEFAMVESLTGIVCQLPIFLRGALLVEMMAAVYLHHHFDGLLVVLYSAHIRFQKPTIE